MNGTADDHTLAGNQRLLGPAGFTRTEAVQAILNPYEYDTAARYGWRTDPDWREAGDKVDFEGLPVAEAERLLAVLPAAQADDRQNGSPSFAEFIERFRDWPGATLHGYRINKRRGDERITIEGVMVPYDPLTKEQIIELCAMGADEADRDDVNGQAVFRLWWD